MTSPASKSEMLQNLRMLLREAFILRNQGAAHAKIARAQGYADGYMRGLVETHVVDQRELLRLVGDERCAVDGPATQVVEEQTHVIAA
jgi:hypothetical protein